MKFFVLIAGMLLLPSAAMAATQDFGTWLSAFKAEAVSRGISQQTLAAALPSDMQPIPRVIELDRKQPESVKTFEQYLVDAVNPKRVEQGRTRLLNNRAHLQRISETYGVDPEVILALWGMETSYGQNTGGYSVTAALATLAHDGRRSAFFRDELFKALQIINEGHISAASMKGSWAGAMGQCQFMPSSFLRFAVDYNKDGKRDIWNTLPDVFASTANYLSQSGWKKGQSWGRRVKVPANIDRSLLGIGVTRPLQAWHDSGVRMPDGSAIPFEGAYQASVIQPDGPGTSAFVIYDNYRVLLKWNKSNYFATSVGLLSDKLKGW